jgi:hypothetical protein
MVDLTDVEKAIGANYAVWNADTTITLTNVPWDNTYRDIVKFANKTALNTYLEEQGVKHTSIGRARFVKADEPIKLPLPIDKVYPYNYVRVHNPAQKPVNGEEIYYYYFIIGIDFVGPTVTQIRVQLDVWQTFGDKARIASAFVTQGHIGIANEKQFEDYGRKYLTVPEGQELGAEMLTSNVSTHAVLQNDPSVVMVCSANLFIDPETGEGRPELGVGRANYVQGMLSGIPTFFFKDMNAFQNFTLNYGDYPWVMNSIKSITLVPNAFANGEQYTELKLKKGSASVYYMANNAERGRGKYVNLRSDFRNAFNSNIPLRYRHLKKLYTYPYCAIEMTLFQGANVVLKPELLPRDDAWVAIKSANITPGQKMAIYMRSYNAKSSELESTRTNADGSKEFYYDFGDYLENALVMDNYPALAIAGDAGNLSLAQNYNSIAQQRTAADWAQQRSLQGNQTSYDQAGAAVGNMETQGDISRWTTQRRNDIANTAQGAHTAIGAIGSAAGGNVVGAAATAGNGLVDIIARGRETDTTLAASRASQGSNVGTANYIRDTNKDLADWAAKGDNAQAIAAINAKVQDLALTPPFSVGVAGGEQFLMTQGQGVQLYLLFKTIGPNAMMNICEYWLRYGYAINTYVRNIPNDLMVMSNFTYWRLVETYLVGTNLPEWVKAAIRGIFEKGVTVWQDPRKIGLIDIADNVAKTGISY